MALKIGNWLIGSGCYLAMAGLCFLPAAFGPHRDTSLLSAGAVLFSMGMVLTASGIYVKARHWAQAAPASARHGNARFGKKGGPKVCDLCSKQEAVIQCRVHQLQLCADCLGKHYDFRSCAYVPSTRQGNSKARAHSHASGA